MFPWPLFGAILKGESKPVDAATSAQYPFVLDDYFYNRGRSYHPRPHTCDVCSRIVLEPSFAGYSFQVLTFTGLEEFAAAYRKCLLIRVGLQLRLGQSFEQMEKMEDVEAQLEPLMEFAVKGRIRRLLKPRKRKVKEMQLWIELTGKDEVSDEQEGKPLDLVWGFTMWWGNDSSWKGAIRLFRVYAEPNDPAAELVVERPLNRYPGSAWMVHRARDWLAECLSVHESENCAYSPAQPPSRLVDTWAVRLVTREEVASEVDFAALSYCWGPNSDKYGVKTTKANIESYRSRIPLEKLPQSLRDGIVIARPLGLRYIWIDFLCIIQDDDEDKAREISNMQNIYSTATVTICIAGASSASEGFLHERQLKENLFTQDRIRMKMWCPPHQLGSVIAQPGRFAVVLKEFDEREPIEKRAWTLQEFRLSKRILWFGSLQTRWYCSDCVCVDGGSVPGKPESPVPKSFNTKTIIGQVNKLWYETIIEYSKRSLSNPNDKLDALAAVAAEHGQYRDAVGDAKYLAGIWADSIHGNLFWYNDIFRFDNDLRWVERPSSYRAPSWSWACLDGPIAIQTSNQPGLPEHQLKMLEMKTELCHEVSTYGAVKRAWLKCLGLIQKVRLEYFKFDYYMFWAETATSRFPTTLLWDTWYGKPKRFPSPLPEKFQEVFLLIVERSAKDECHGLILLPTEEKDTFMREGIWRSIDEENYSYAPAPQQWLEDCKERTIRIV